MLTKLLERKTLTTEQRVQALYHRGSLRRQKADNRRGAVEDFEKLLKIAPDHKLASRTETELAFARDDVKAIEASLNRFLTLSQWFDGIWVLGEHDEAATRYQRSGLAPTPEQVEKLQAAGYICSSNEDDNKLHLYGETRDDLEGLQWCSELNI